MSRPPNKGHLNSMASGGAITNLLQPFTLRLVCIREKTGSPTSTGSHSGHAVEECTVVSSDPSISAKGRRAEALASGLCSLK